MKIAVCVKAVPDAPTTRLDATTFRLDRDGELTLNTADRPSVEAALQLRESFGELEVVAVSVGPPQALAALRFALAMGADRGVLVADEAATGSDLLGTARILAAVLEREAPELTLFGQQAVDSNGALLWAAVADRLGLPVVSRAGAVTLRDGKVVAHRRGELGMDAIEAPLPCAVAVSASINEPRMPTFRQLKRALDKPYDVVSVADLGISPAAVGLLGSRTVVHALVEPETGRETRWIHDDEGHAAEDLLDFLVSRRLVL